MRISSTPAFSRPTLDENILSMWRFGEDNSFFLSSEVDPIGWTGIGMT
jgi:hypothetical protein